jgi:hypothetical protein
VEGTGRRHIAYLERIDGVENDWSLKYATCLDQTNCTMAANWQKLTIDAAAGRGPVSLTVTSDGRRHVSYYQGGKARALTYATCVTNCTVGSNWIKVLVDTAAAVYSSIAVGTDGRRHISYRGRVGGAGSSLRYATCLTSCSQAANWQKLTIEGPSTETGSHLSLALDANGVLHVSYFGHRSVDLKYARCPADCTNSGGWQRVTLDSIGDPGRYTSIAVGSNSRVHISHYDQATGDLDYATCPADCLRAVNWTSPHVDGKFADVGQYSSLALGGGLVHISYFDRTNGDLKYLELSP